MRRSVSLKGLATWQNVLIAVLAFAGGVLLLLAHGYVRWSVHGWSAPVRLRALPLAVMCVGMLFRRSAPMTGLAISSAGNVLEIVLGPSLGGAVIYTDALYAATLYGPRRAERWLLGTTAGASLAVVAGVGALLGSLGPGVVMGAVAGTTWLTPVLTAMIVREHRDRAEAERERAGQVARLAEMDRLAAVAAERARMARELHDVVANHLSAVALHSTALLRVPDLDPDGLRQAMEVIRENSVQGLAEMRRMIGLLREDGADSPAAPRLDELDRLVAHVARSDLSARLEVVGEPYAPPAAVELAAYRIVQESLTNALKHGGSGLAEVRLTYGTGRVGVEVVSPLGGESELPGAGAGLVGMRERAVLLGGAFDAGASGGSWVVRADLPLDGGEAR
ncbi:sensor histidine kinase [Actinomadura rupiterrae]|uniref:sensor histidine kinase n=1 Tax=Actinomadura rupiterrae TaxID=559627 RepID=UPI0020A3BEC5|nr:histidine kinase [Actinomadura rupiterrae]MCP2341289.1 signal transduction histidine kinase [Actinomadura rupiterrae]